MCKSLSIFDSSASFKAFEATLVEGDKGGFEG